MFEKLHSITLEMKLFLFHQILYSISKAFFSSSLSKNIFTKELRALHPLRKLKDMPCHECQISSQEDLLTFQFLWFHCGEKSLFSLHIVRAWNWPNKQVQSQVSALGGDFVLILILIFPARREVSSRENTQGRQYLQSEGESHHDLLTFCLISVQIQLKCQVVCWD